MADYKTLFDAAICAENAYSLELVKTYGKNGSSDARYDRKKNEATSELKRLSDERNVAGNVLREFIKGTPAEIAETT